MELRVTIPRPLLLHCDTHFHKHVEKCSKTVTCASAVLYRMPLLLNDRTGHPNTQVTDTHRFTLCSYSGFEVYAVRKRNLAKAMPGRDPETTVDRIYFLYFSQKGDKTNMALTRRQSSFIHHLQRLRLT